MKRLFTVALLCVVALVIGQAGDGTASSTPGRGERGAGFLLESRAEAAAPWAPGARNPLAPFTLILDDGTQEAVFGLNMNYHGIPLIAINRFTPNPAFFPVTINSISIQFPAPGPAHGDLTGRNIDLLVYEDPSGSGDPTNATKIYQQTFQIQVANGSSFSTYQVNVPVQSPGDLYIGFSNTYDRGNLLPYTYPVPIDRTASQLRSWIASNVNGSDPNYEDLGNNDLLSLIDNIGGYLGGNFVVRAGGESAIGPSSTPTNTPTRTPTSIFSPTPTQAVPTIPPGTILYDQYDHISINTTNSQNYEPYMAAYNDFGADDFVVPAGQNWRIEQVDVAGRLNGNGPVRNFNVALYTNAGVPGTLVYTATNLAYSTPVANQYSIALPSPTTLNSGTYWVMVQANLDWWTGGGQWGWYNRGMQSNIVAAWHNPGDAWATACNENWGIRWMCLGDASNPDQVFRLKGGGTGWVTTTPAPTFTSTSSPTRTATLPAGATATRTSTSPAGATPTFTSTSTPTPPAGSVTATACAIQFTDVDSNHTFYPFIRCLACRGIINGYTSGCATGDPCFRPENNVTRGQVAKIVSNAAGFSDPITAQSFEDVPVGSTFHEFVGRLAMRGIVGGYACGGAGEPCNPPLNLPYFRPNANVTRGQLAKMDSEAAGYSDVPSGQQFEDVAQGSTFYTYTYRLATRTIMSGYACGGVGEPCNPPLNLPYFRPGNPATRGQTAKIVANTFYPNCQTPRK